MTVLDDRSVTETPVSRPTAPTKRPRSIRTWINRGGLSTLLFALPIILIFAIYSWWPILQSLWLSMQKTNLITYTFVGFDNFANVLRDPNLGVAIGNTAWFAVLAFIFGFPLPILMAVLMSEVKRMKGFYSALAYLPVVVPPVVAVLLWKSSFFSASENGVFNTILGWAGIPPQPWIQSATQAMPSLVLEATWAAAGGSIIIYLAALIAVPPELYDAAEVDGSSVWRKIWHVTLPQLRGIIFIMLILQVIATAQVFLEPYLFTNGGPNNATLTILLLIYRYAFGSLGAQYGEATALSVMLAIFLAVLSFLYFKATSKWSDN